MVADKRPIGVMDSGVGGLTVARELQRLLPWEDIIYCGDNINVPYGNRSEEEIYKLSKKMVDFLIEEDVKIIAVACNTISSIVDKYFKDYKLPIISIISPASKYIVDNDIRKVGVIATKFTIETGTYEKLIKKEDSSIEVISEASPNLATVIDRGSFTDEEVEEIVDLHMENIIKKGSPENIILGCTHYPIVLDKFTKKSPDKVFINPALEQVNYIRNLLNESNELAAEKDRADFKVYTSGEVETYEKIIKLLKMKPPKQINKLSEFKLPN